MACACRGPVLLMGLEMSEMVAVKESDRSAAGLNDIMERVSEKECCFVVADWDGCADGGAEHDDPVIRKLESELKRSELTFYRIEGIPIKSAFLVCNNAYTPANFKKLVTRWICDFGLGALFMTNPTKHSDHGRKRTVRVEGFYLDGMGNATIITDNVTFGTIRKYLNLGQNTKPTLTLVQETRSFDTVTSAGRRVSCAQFDRLYPPVDAVLLEGHQGGHHE